MTVNFEKPDLTNLGTNCKRIDYKGLAVIVALNEDGTVRFDAYDHNEGRDVCKIVMSNKVTGGIKMANKFEARITTLTHQIEDRKKLIKQCLNLVDQDNFTAHSVDNMLGTLVQANLDLARFETELHVLKNVVGVNHV